MCETAILVGVLSFIFGFTAGTSITSGLYMKKFANKKNDDRCTEINIIEL